MVRGSSDEPEKAKQPSTVPVVTAQPVAARVVDAIPSSQERIVQLVARQASSYEGPIPPPALFKQYGEVVADAPERILQQFEKDAEHFRNTTTTALKGEIAHNLRAQWMAFALVLIGIAAAIYEAGVGHQAIAGAIIVTLLVAVLVNFLRPNGKPPPVSPDETPQHPDQAPKKKRRRQ